ncbi:MAG: hypothetical protein ABI651_00070 [Verrucomicrobiota bacterium]
MEDILQSKGDRAATPTLANACLTSCRKLIAQIEKTKDGILAQFREKLEAHEHLLRLALNEAEAIAWETEFPHLVFPMLATEKAQDVVTWFARQRSINRQASVRTPVG